jgi:LysM repeat protein
MKTSASKLLLYIATTAVVGGAVIGVILLKPWQLLATRAQARTETVFALDLDQAVIPQHSTQQVQASFASEVPIRQVQLWVNAQLWADEVLDPPQTSVDRSWDWSPSGEGVHELLLRYQLTDGTEHLSPPVEVYAAQGVDVHFPVEYQVQAGDTLESVARELGSPLPMLLDSNSSLGLGSDVPLPEGAVLTVPVPLPNAAQAYPASGEAAAPPVKPLPSGASLPNAGEPGSVQAVAADLPPEALMPGFQLIGGQLKTPVPVDQLYLYFRLANAPWLRSPADPDAFYDPGPNGTFDVSLDLDLEALQKLPKPVPLDLEAWGWTGGNLIFLGLYHDLVGGPGGSLSWPPQATQLKVLDYTNLGKSIFATDINISGSQPTLTRKFHWNTTEPDANHILWQVSVVPFNSPALKYGLVHTGNRPGAEGDFTLDFRDYFKSWGSNGGSSSSFLDPIKGLFEDLTNTLSGSTKPKQVGWPFKPWTFYVRAIPMDASGSVGKPSNTVVVHFTPAGVPVESAGPLDGPVYDAKIISFVPYRAPDPAYSACFVTNFETKNCSSIANQLEGNKVWYTPGDVAAGIITQAQYNQCYTAIPKGSPSCGCPGVKCESSDDSCGWNPICYAGKGLEALGSALKAGYDFLAKAYNETVAFIKKMAAELNPLCIQAKIAAKEFGGETVTEEDVADVCQAVTDIAVTAAMTYFGLPPSLPDFDKLADEGLDYAIGIATSEMGFECNKQCRDLIKKGFKAASSGENLFQAGLDLGADMAASELDKIGVNCDQKCKNLMKDTVKGKASFGQLTGVALDQATNEIVKKLQDNGYFCDEDCKKAIRQGLEQGSAIGAFANNNQANVQPEPWYVPHELGVEQRAVVRIEIFRRWESAGVSGEDLDKCNVALYNQASNSNFSQPVTGKLFSNEGIDLPLLAPGESMTIPVVLERVPWSLPPGVSKNIPPSSGNVIYASVLDPVYSSWHEFYPGAQITFDVTGPNFLALDGQGGTVSIPCVAGDSLQTAIPLNP